MRTAITLSVNLCLALALGCSGNSGEDMGPGPGMDMGQPDFGPLGDAGDVPPTIEIGTGEETFSPLMAGQMVDIVEGRQAGGGRFGGHHVVWALRFTNLPLSSLDALRMEVTDSSGARLGYRELEPSLAPALPNGMGGMDLTARNIPFEDCCMAADQDITLKVQAPAKDGTNHEFSLTVRASGCPAQGATVCDG